MHAFKAISLLALVSASVALPQPWKNMDNNKALEARGPHGGPGGFGRGFHRPGGFEGHAQEDEDEDETDYSNVVYEDYVVTATATVTANAAFGGYQPTGSPSSGGYSGGYDGGDHGSAPETPVTTPAPSTGGSSTGYMAVVDTWRSKLGLSKLTQDSQLEANALKTARDGNGKMKHQLIGKTMAQVLAPGSAGEFEHVFVGGWLCERPSMAGLNGVCATQSKGWSYGGQTGHADILVSKAYKSIGCAQAGGIWSCDLA